MFCSRKVFCSRKKWRPAPPEPVKIHGTLEVGLAPVSILSVTKEGFCSPRKTERGSTTMDILFRPAWGRAGYRCLPLLIALTVAGCGRRVGEVSGKVTYKDTPVVMGSVVFVGSDGIPHRGQIEPDGTYVVSDVPAGPVQVAVISPDPGPPLRPGERRPMHPTRTGSAGPRPLGVGPGLPPPGPTRPGSRPGRCRCRPPRAPPR